MSLSRDAILAARRDWPRETVECPELGGAVQVRTLTLGQAERIQRAQKENADNPLRLYVHLAAEALCDDAGAPLFTAEDHGVIAELPFAALERVALAALRLNGMRPEDGEAARKN